MSGDFELPKDFTPVSAISVNSAARSPRRPIWSLYIIAFVVLLIIGAVFLVAKFNQPNAAKMVNEYFRLFLSAEAYHRESNVNLLSVARTDEKAELDVFPVFLTQFLDKDGLDLSAKLTGDVVRSQVGRDADLDLIVSLNDEVWSANLIVKDGVGYVRLNNNLPFLPVDLLGKTIKLTSNTQIMTMWNDDFLRVLGMESNSSDEFYLNLFNILSKAEILQYRDREKVSGQIQYNFIFDFDYNKLIVLRNSIIELMGQEINKNNLATMQLVLDGLNESMKDEKVDAVIETLNRGILSVATSKQKITLTYQNVLALANMEKNLLLAVRHSVGLVETRNIIEPQGVVNIDELVAIMMPQRISDNGGVEVIVYNCEDEQLAELRWRLNADSKQASIDWGTGRESILLNQISSNFYVSIAQDISVNFDKADSGKISVQRIDQLTMICRRR